MIKELPNFIQEKIFSYLLSKNINSLALVSKDYYYLTLPKRENKLIPAMKLKAKRLEKAIEDCHSQISGQSQQLLRKILIGGLVIMFVIGLAALCMPEYKLERPEFKSEKPEYESYRQAPLMNFLVMMVGATIASATLWYCAKYNAISSLKKSIEEQKKLNARLQANKANVLTFLSRQSESSQPEVDLRAKIE